MHTALTMAGTAAQELMIAAVAEYIVRHQHPAGDAAHQRQVAMAGLGMGVMPGLPEITLQTPPAIRYHADLREAAAGPAPQELPIVVGDFLSSSLDDC